MSTHLRENPRETSPAQRHRRFSRADIAFHCDGYGNQSAHAAVNVKVPYLPPAAWVDLAARVGTDHGGDRAYLPPFAAFVAEIDAEQIQLWIDAACEDGWERAEEIARETFGDGYGVTSEGRSGGWAVVTYHDRPTFARDEIAAWDAIAVTRWGRFARRLDDEVADLPYQALSLIYLNLYEPEADRRAEAAERAGADPFGLASVGM